MKKFLFALCLGLTVTQVGAETSCEDLGTQRDPYVIFNQENLTKKPFDRDAYIAKLEIQNADAKRCKNKEILEMSEMVLVSLKQSRAEENAKSAKSESPVTGEEPASPKAVKNLTVECDYGKKKPFTKVLLTGIELENGQVIAEGSHEDMGIKLSFNNKNPSQGRTLDVFIQSTTISKTLSGNLESIEYSSGMMSKMLGVQGRHKVKCHPLKQTATPSAPEATPAQNDGDRAVIEKDSSKSKDASNGETQAQGQ